MREASTPGGSTPPTRAYPDSGTAARALIRGLYAITPDQADTNLLLEAVEQTLAAGTRLLQYRNKTAGPDLRKGQLMALRSLCATYDCTLVVNDDWRLAIELGIGAVHIGGEDGDAQAVREAIGPSVILGVSCYASLERARAVLPYADYLAFGSVFASGTKPGATSAPLRVLREARGLGKPVVAIGGIDAANAGRVLASGADAVAVVGGVFGTGSITGSTDALIRVIAEFERRSPR